MRNKLAIQAPKLNADGKDHYYRLGNLRIISSPFWRKIRFVICDFYQRIVYDKPGFFSFYDKDFGPQVKKFWENHYTQWKEKTQKETKKDGNQNH